jgi:uncharacterized membrane protein
VPNSTTTEAHAIADNGQITGRYYDTSGVSHGYLRSATGTFTTFDPERSTNTQPLAINPKGQIIGLYVDKKDLGYAFLRKK